MLNKGDNILPGQIKLTIKYSENGMDSMKSKIKKKQVTSEFRHRHILSAIQLMMVTVLFLKI